MCVVYIGDYCAIHQNHRIIHRYQAITVVLLKPKYSVRNSDMSALPSQVQIRLNLVRIFFVPKIVTGDVWWHYKRVRDVCLRIH